MLDRVHAYMGGTVKSIGGHPITIGGTPNHAHLLVTLPATITAAYAVGNIKANLTGWAHKNIPTMSDFAWQGGYGVFSVSRSQIDVVASYIRDQQRHHETMTFEEEFVAMLKKHGLEYDARYVWG